MSVPAISPTQALRAALPHLRRYAMVLTASDHEADALVVETLGRARELSLAETTGLSLRTRLFALMHGLHAGRAARLGDRPAAAAGPNPIESEPGKAPGLLARFKSLPTDEREILLLVAVERMRYEDIARLLQVPVSTVIARLKRARDFMRECQAL